MAFEVARTQARAGAAAAQSRQLLPLRRHRLTDIRLQRSEAKKGDAAKSRVEAGLPASVVVSTMDKLAHSTTCDARARTRTEWLICVLRSERKNGANKSGTAIRAQTCRSDANRSKIGSNRSSPSNYGRARAPTAAPPRALTSRSTRAQLVTSTTAARRERLDWRPSRYGDQ